MGLLRLLGACCLVGVLVSAAHAEDLDAGKRVWSTTAGCVRCHGWAGDGRPELPAFPDGANLRASSLDRMAVREVVECGIPGTEMPRFSRAAYRQRPCYGLTAGQVERLPHLDTVLSGAEVDALLDYVMAKIVGRGAANRAACEEYYGAGALACGR